MKKVLAIQVLGSEAAIAWGNTHRKFRLDKKPFLWEISRIVGDPLHIENIRLGIKDARFSDTRQVVTVVNVFAWVSGAKINRKLRVHAHYTKPPNITKPKR